MKNVVTLAAAAAVVFGLSFAVTARAAPLDECSRPHLLKTMPGKCAGDRKALKRSQQAPAGKAGEVGRRNERPSKADTGRNERSKGNASANNGKGGNYDRTGHSDNGKGQGRNRK